MTKTCKKCNTEKYIDEFYKHPGMKDGRLNFCKNCVRERVSSHRKTEHGREVERLWRKTPKGRVKSNRLHAKYFNKYPEKRMAHVSVSNAIRDGRLFKKPCEVCGCINVEAHHDDYSKPLDVRWLCGKHHKEHHKLEEKEETAVT